MWPPWHHAPICAIAACSIIWLHNTQQPQHSMCTTKVFYVPLTLPPEIIHRIISASMYAKGWAPPDYPMQIYCECAKMQTQSQKLLTGQKHPFDEHFINMYPHPHPPTHTHTHTHTHTLTHSQVARSTQKEQPIFCSAVFSACLLYSPPEPCSHSASISFMQSNWMPRLFLSISCSLLYFSPSWVPRCSHWYTTSVSATINKGRWLSISVSEITVLNIASLFGYTTTHPVCHQEYQTGQQRRQLVPLKKVHEGNGHKQRTAVQKVAELVLCDKQHNHRIKILVAVTNYKSDDQCIIITIKIQQKHVWFI